MSGTVKVIKVLSSKGNDKLRLPNESVPVKGRPSFEGGKFVVRVGENVFKKRTEVETPPQPVSDISSAIDPPSSEISQPTSQLVKIEDTVDYIDNTEVTNADAEAVAQEEGFMVVLPNGERGILSHRHAAALSTGVVSGEVRQVHGGFQQSIDGHRELIVGHEDVGNVSTLPSNSGGHVPLLNFAVKNSSPMTGRSEPNEAISVADPCCYPPSERTVHLLKMLAGAEILSIKELAEIVAYITYLRRRKLVTDYLLKEGVTTMQELDPEPDDEPPLVRSHVRFPLKVEKRSLGRMDDDSPMTKMPRLVDVLKKDDHGDVPLMTNTVDLSHWPFNVTTEDLARVPPSTERVRLKTKAKKVIAACEMCGTRVNEKQLKAHTRTCRGIIIKWRKGRSVLDDLGAPSEEERCERSCPRCEKVLTCDRDFEMHMAVAHKFYWRLDFENETDFDQWFRDEGLDETMIAGPSKTHGDIHEKVFYCAINGGARMKVKCPCRLAIKKSPQGVIARYSVLHNHTERYVRQQMSNECRDLIINMLKMGLRNYEILKLIKETYPKTSMNYLVTSQAITRLRYRYRRTNKVLGRRGRRPAGVVVEVDSQREQFADFGDEKPPEASVWPLPDLQCANIGLSNAYAEGEGPGPGECTLIN